MALYTSAQYRAGHQGYVAWKAQTAQLVYPHTITDPSLQSGPTNVFGPCSLPSEDITENVTEVRGVGSSMALGHVPGRREINLALRGGTDVARNLVLAEGLSADCLQRYGVEPAGVRQLARFKGQELEHLRLQHPFHARQVPVILGDHVTLEAGTGAVHTAPAHGMEDYVAGLRYRLPVDNPVQGDGRFKPDVPLVGALIGDRTITASTTMRVEGP